MSDQNEKKKSPKEEKWNPMPAVSVFTFPPKIFTLYTAYLALTLVLYIPILIIVLVYQKIIVGGLHYVLFRKPNQLLTPIKPSPKSYVVVTGAASGIGLQMVEIYASKGFSVVLVDVNPKAKNDAQDLKQRYTAQDFRFVIVDLSDPSAADQVYDQVMNKMGLTGVEILVNNAGYGMTGEFLNQEAEKLTKMMTVNSTVCMQLAHKFGRHFVLKNKGRICQVASCAAYNPGPHASVYHATKAFARYFMLGLRYELMGTGVGCTVVCPGAVRTEFATRSQSNLSLAFTFFKNFSYSPKEIAQWSVDATLNGTEEIHVGPMWAAIQNFFFLMGDAFNIIGTRVLWQNNVEKTRSIYDNYRHK